LRPSSERRPGLRGCGAAAACSGRGPGPGGGPARGRSLLLLQCLVLLRAPAGLLGDQTRRVSLEVIPGPTDPSQNLLHIRAVGVNSTIHYIWSSLGPPAVLFVATDTPHSVLSVNWTCLLSPKPEGSLAVLPAKSVRFSSALIFPKLFEFDSTNSSEVKNGSPGKPYPPYLLADFSWDDVNSTLDPTMLSATFQGRPSKDPLGAFSNGSLAFKLDQLLWHSSPEGFLQWRPVAFSKKQPDWKTALPCQVSPPGPTLATLLPQSSIVRAFFGSSANFCTFNLTFGDSTGPAYENQRYLSWSALLGVGSPPVDSFSPLVLGIMVVVLGAPALLLVGGGLSLLLLRHRRYSEYEPIS
uniref:Glycosylated lysosomal membrane protein n=1 Tax=Vombatus ursinus TaxID=29139 RepID=A0A4X2LB26_VOMUR